MSPMAVFLAQMKLYCPVNVTAKVLMYVYFSIANFLTPLPLPPDTLSLNMHFFPFSMRALFQKV